jgi:hypothetical protein
VKEGGTETELNLIGWSWSNNYRQFLSLLVVCTHCPQLNTTVCTPCLQPNWIGLPVRFVQSRVCSSVHMYSSVELVLHPYSCVKASKTVLRLVLWTDQLKNMQPARVKLSEDKTQVMKRVQAYQKAQRLEFYLKEVTGEDVGDKQGVPN